MFRKKREPAPFFKMPGAPFNPATGKRAPLGQFPVQGTTLAIFQVVGDDPNDPGTADAHDDYIVCRGYEPTIDPKFRYLHDPYTFNGTAPINVAKPYALRGTFTYKQGQVVVAARIRTALGDNQGVASTTVGQPADLTETLDLLLDANSKAISWLDIGTAPEAAGQKTLYYSLNKPVKGFSTVGNYSVIRPSSASGWLGAAYVVGSESDVGVQYQNAETAPDTNGNFKFTKAGLYRVEIIGLIRTNFGTGSTSGQYLKPRFQTFLKLASGGGNSGLLDAAGWPIGDWWDTLVAWDSAHSSNLEMKQQLSVLFEDYFRVNDKLSFKLSNDFISISGTDPSVGVNINTGGSFMGPFLHFTYMGTADQSFTSATSFP